MATAASPASGIDNANDVLASVNVNEQISILESIERQKVLDDSDTEAQDILSSSTTLSPPIHRTYSVSELINALQDDSLSEESPELSQRLEDFRWAQSKREETSRSRPWGIYGMYTNLRGVRTDLEWAEDAAYRRLNGKPYLRWNDFEEARASYQKPYCVWTMIAICFIMLLVEIGVNGWKLENFKVNPMLGPSAETLIHVGARVTTLIVEENEWYRIFSALFLHAGLIHFAINMLALYFIGGAIELSHGPIATGLLMLLPGVGGNLWSAIFLPQFITVGASGSIFGLIGGCLVDIIINWKILSICLNKDNSKGRNAIAPMLWLVLDVLVNVLLGLTPYIDNFTHMGGLVYGMATGATILQPVATGFLGISISGRGVGRALLGLVLTLVGILGCTIYLATATVGENFCPGCKYLSCVPFPPWKSPEERWWNC